MASTNRSNAILTESVVTRIEVYVHNNLCDELKLCQKFHSLLDLTSVISKLLFVANVKTLLLGKKSDTKDKMSTQV